MSPFLITGDRLLVKKIPCGDLATGDLIVYREKYEFTVHRFISVKTKKDGSSYIESKADNYTALDEPVVFERLLGKVLEIERDGKRIFLDRTTLRFFSLIAGIASRLEAEVFNGARKIRALYFSKIGRGGALADNIARLISAPKKILIGFIGYISRRGRAHDNT